MTTGAESRLAGGCDNQVTTGAESQVAVSDTAK